MKLKEKLKFSKKMNLHKKLLSLTIGPLLVVGLVTIGATSANLPRMTAKNLETGFQSTALAINQIFTRQSGDYVKKIDQIWKGTLNITAEQDMFKEISASTGMDIIFFWDNTSAATSICDKDGNPVTGMSLNEKIYKTVVDDGEAYFGKNIKVNGDKYYAYVLPIHRELTDAVVGMLFVGQKSSVVNKTMNGVLMLLIGLVVVLAGIAIYIGTVFSQRLTRAIQRNINAADRLSRGVLNVDITEEDKNRTDELGVLAASIISISNGLKNIVGNARECTDSLSEASTHMQELTETSAADVEVIRSATTDIAQATVNQAVETDRANNSMNIISGVINDAGTSVTELNESADIMQQKSEEALVILNDLRSTNEDVRKAVDTIYEQTLTTNKSAQAIDEAVSIISNIATQTNLLSLNASIEAARAGEAGRGFSVVATEIKSLAEQSNASANSIRKVIETLRKDSGNAVATMDSMKKVIIEQNGKVDKTADIFDEVGSNINLTVDASHKIADQVARLADVRGEIQDVLSNLAASSEENAASAQQTSTSMASVAETVREVSESAEILGTMFTKLNNTLAVFVMEEDEVAMAEEVDDIPTIEESASEEPATDIDLSEEAIRDEALIDGLSEEEVPADEPIEETPTEDEPTEEEKAE